MVRLNRAGNSQRNPIITAIPFQIRYHKHSADETLTSCWISLSDGSVFVTLTGRCVVSDFMITVDVTAGTDLQSGDPPVLNVINFTTVIGAAELHTQRGIFVVDPPETFIALDGYNAPSSGEPLVFRPLEP
jgi:hypothetical protein